MIIYNLILQYIFRFTVSTTYIVFLIIIEFILNHNWLIYKIDL